jgi:hypothetical protein
LALNLVDPEAKSAKLSLEATDLPHKDSQWATFGHSQIVPLIAALAK